MAGDWQELLFADAVVVNPTVRLERGQRYPFVDMGAVNPSSRCAYASEEREFSGGGARFQHGDTLMARITPCLENGKIARFCAPGRAGVGHGSTEFIVIRGRPEVTDTDFAYYLTKWDEVRSYAVGQMTGTSGRQRVPTDSLEHLAVPIPPLPEQRAIAHILGTLDDKIELNRRMSETLEQMARALFKSWFVDFDPVRAKMEGRWKPGECLPGMPAHLYDLFPDRLVNSELGQIPEGWEVVSLGDLADVEKGLSYKGAGLAEEGGLPMVNLGCFAGQGVFKAENIKRYVGEYRDRHLVHAGDLVIANTDMTQNRVVLGSPALLPALDGERCFLFTHHTFAFRFKPGAERWRGYVYFKLLQPEFREIAEGFATGTTVLALPRDGLLRYSIVLPSESLRLAFEGQAHALLAAVDRGHEESLTLAALRDALLPKLISGELRVKAAEQFISKAVWW